MRLTVVLPAILALLCTLSQPAAAQGLFSPAIKVNDRVITEYEIDQRARLLRVLQSVSNPDAMAREGLIEDRLRLDAAESAGLVLSDAQVREGMEDFAERANLSLPQFLARLSAQEIAEQTLRDFVQAGVSWREIVRARFGRLAQVSEDEIDRALASGSSGSGVRVLLSEIIIPAPPERLSEVQDVARRISNIRSFQEFSNAARQVSATRTRDRGGRLDWLPLGQLPPQLRGVVLQLQPGEVTDPIPLDNAIALFQLRAVDETGAAEPTYAAIDYAAFYLDGGKSPETLSEAARIGATTDGCDDLYGVAKGLPPEQLERNALPPAQIPDDVALELAKLDPGEISTTLTRNDGQTLMLLMLCGRTTAINEQTDRAAIASQLRNQKLTAYADSFLAQLKADALIVEQ